MAAYNLIKPLAVGEPLLVLADETSILAGTDVDKAIRHLRGSVDWNAFLLMEERAREKGMRENGRYTILAAAKELAANTGIKADRWEQTLLAEVKQGKLPLRNPRDFGDQLPYAVPSEMDFVLALEHVTISDLNVMLEANPNWAIVFRFDTGSAILAAAVEARFSISRQQEIAVIKKIRELGIDPQSFPKNPPGRPGRKAEVRDAILKNPSHLFPSSGTFDATWERLRAVRKIIDAPVAGGIPKN